MFFFNFQNLFKRKLKNSLNNLLFWHNYVRIEDEITKKEEK